MGDMGGMFSAFTILVVRVRTINNPKSLGYPRTFPPAPEFLRISKRDVSATTYISTDAYVISTPFSYHYLHRLLCDMLEMIVVGRADCIVWIAPDYFD